MKNFISHSKFLKILSSKKLSFSINRGLEKYNFSILCQTSSEIIMYCRVSILLKMVVVLNIHKNVLNNRHYFEAYLTSFEHDFQPIKLGSRKLQDVLYNGRCFDNLLYNFNPFFY